MGRFLVFVEDCKTGFKDEWVIFAKDDPSASMAVYNFKKRKKLNIGGDALCIVMKLSYKIVKIG